LAEKFGRVSHLPRAQPAAVVDGMRDRGLVGADGWARHEVVNWRRSSAYASLVRLRYPARNPARASRSASVKAGWIVASAVDGAAVVIGHLRAGLRPGEAGPAAGPSD
jgi:hypothetical protein